MQRTCLIHVALIAGSNFGTVSAQALSATTGRGDRIQQRHDYRAARLAQPTAIRMRQCGSTTEASGSTIACTALTRGSTVAAIIGMPVDRNPRRMTPLIGHAAEA